MPMTLKEITEHIELAVVYGAPVAAAVGALGHALAATPWKWSKALGNALNSVTIDFLDLLNSVKNAKASMAAKAAKEDEAPPTPKTGSAA